MFEADKIFKKAKVEHDAKGKSKISSSGEEAKVKAPIPAPKPKTKCEILNLPIQTAIRQVESETGLRCLDQGYSLLKTTFIEYFQGRLSDELLDQLIELKEHFKYFKIANVEGYDELLCFGVKEIPKTKECPNGASVYFTIAWLRD